MVTFFFSIWANGGHHPDLEPPTLMLTLALNLTLILILALTMTLTQRPACLVYCGIVVLGKDLRSCRAGTSKETRLLGHIYARFAIISTVDSMSSHRQQQWYCNIIPFFFFAFSLL